ncbi:MAG: alanine racemase [Pseudobdellovibrionaceae bacterium]
MFKLPIKCQKNFRGTVAFIDTQALAFNIHSLRQSLHPESFFCPMIKANAYGHGDIEVARVLQAQDVKQLGVCSIEEAIYLRENGIKTDILFFSGFSDKNILEVLQYNLIPVVSHWGQLQALVKVPKPISFHLKFDTGMARLGFSFADIEKVHDFIKIKNISGLRGVCSHLYQSDEPFHSECITAGQLKIFSKITQLFCVKEDIKPHILNTAGIEQKVESQADVFLHKQQVWGARPGLGTYGYGSLSKKLKLKPVMSLRSSILDLREVEAGTCVSYNGRWTAPKKSLLGIVQAGYGDGYNRILTNKGEVLFCGQVVPVVSTVCMDYLFIDITALDGKVSREQMRESAVTLWGYDEHSNLMSVADVAQKAQTIPWELLTQVSQRVPRIYNES